VVGLWLGGHHAGVFSIDSRHHIPTSVPSRFPQNSAIFRNIITTAP